MLHNSTRPSNGFGDVSCAVSREGVRRRLFRTRLEAWARSMHLAHREVQRPQLPSTSRPLLHSKTCLNGLHQLGFIP